MSNPSEAYQYIVKTDGVCGGAARVANTRITVATIVELAKTATPMELLYTWRIASVDLIAALQYALANRAEIDAEIAEQEKAMAEIQIGSPSAVMKLD